MCVSAHHARSTRTGKVIGGMSAGPLWSGLCGLALVAQDRERRDQGERERAEGEYLCKERRSGAVLRIIVRDCKHGLRRAAAVGVAGCEMISARCANLE